MHQRNIAMLLREEKLQQTPAHIKQTPQGSVAVGKEKNLFSCSTGLPPCTSSMQKLTLSKLESLWHIAQRTRMSSCIRLAASPPPCIDNVGLNAQGCAGTETIRAATLTPMAVTARSVRALHHSCPVTPGSATQPGSWTNVDPSKKSISENHRIIKVGKDL